MPLHRPGRCRTRSTPGWRTSPGSTTTGWAARTTTPPTAAAEQVIAAYPTIRTSVRAQRAFLGRAVHYLAADEGIRQFLDIGTGLPSANNTHEVAQRTAPDARVVYVDKDPIVLSHARALLTGSPLGATEYIDADLRDTSPILEQAAVTLDFRQPVAVMLIGVLH